MAPTPEERHAFADIIADHFRNPGKVTFAMVTGVALRLNCLEHLLHLIACPIAPVVEDGLLDPIRLVLSWRHTPAEVAACFCQSNVPAMTFILEARRSGPGSNSETRTIVIWNDGILLETQWGSNSREIADQVVREVIKHVPALPVQQFHLWLHNALGELWAKA